MKTMLELETDVINASRKMRRHDEASYNAYKREEYDIADEQRVEYHKAWLELRLAVDILELELRRRGDRA